MSEVVLVRKPCSSPDFLHSFTRYKLISEPGPTCRMLFLRSLSLKAALMHHRRCPPLKHLLHVWCEPDERS